MPTIDDIKATYAQMSSDPNFTALNYQDQTNARAEVAKTKLMADPGFMQLPDDQKKVYFQATVRQPPALQDKQLENIVTNAVGKAKTGDKDAYGFVANLSNLNLIGRSSVIGGILGKLSSSLPGFAGASGLPGNTARSLMDGSDAAKLNAYFGDIGAHDKRFSELKPKTIDLKVLQIPTNMAGASEVTGGLVDMGAFMFGPGQALAGAGERAAAGIVTASRAIRIGSKLAIPALADTAAGGVGNIARQNALAIVQKDPTQYTDTIGKLAATFGEGAAANFLFSLGFRAAGEYVAPAIGTLAKGPKQFRDQSLEPTGHLWNRKAASDENIEAAIKSVGGTSNVPDVVLQSLDPYTRDKSWIQNEVMAASKRDPSTMDLRPLDRMVLALNDAPDIVFAPKDWKDPTGSGFNIWEYKSAPGKSERTPKFLAADNADSMGELRTKLSDMLASRFGKIDDLSKPASMPAAQDLIAQGHHHHNFPAKNASTPSKTSTNSSRMLSRNSATPKLIIYLKLHLDFSKS